MSITNKIVNRSQLASILNRNVSTIDNWVRRGMPYTRKGAKGSQWFFNLTDVISWRERVIIEEEYAKHQDVEYEEARRRKMVAEALLLELDLDLRRRNLIPAKDIHEAIAIRYTSIKQRLRAIPARISSAIVGIEDELECRHLLLEEIDSALLELSELRFDGEKDS